jgi:cation transporter-like permease
MKEKIIFLLKAVLFGTLSSAILNGIIMGVDEAINNNSHPHQIFPSWMIGVMFGGVLGAISSLILAIIQIITKKQNIIFISIASAILPAFVVFVAFYVYK